MDKNVHRFAFSAIRGELLERGKVNGTKKASVGQRQSAKVNRRISRDLQMKI